MHSWFERVLKTTLTLALGASLLGGSLHAENDEPFIYATEVSGEDVVVSVHVPSGYQSAVLEISNDVNASWQPIVAGTMAGEEGLVVAPFVYDGFTALIAAGQGASAVYMTGHGTSAQIGLPDVGLTSMAEMVANLGYIVNAVEVPVIADADTGYGNAINAQRTVREYETTGAAAMHLEDAYGLTPCALAKQKGHHSLAKKLQKAAAA